MDMDIFRQDAFSAISLTRAIDRYSYTPSYLQSIPGLVVPAPVRTEEIWIEDRAFAAAIIPTSPRGAAPSQVGGDKRNARSFKTLRYAQASRITPSELQNIRSFGSNDLKTMMEEVARRQFKIKQNFQLTKEFLTLAMIQGKVVDFDGSLLYDWGLEFSQTQPAEVAFGFSVATPTTSDGSIKRNASQIRRTMLRNLKGLGGTQVQIFAACGDEFWDTMTTSKEVERTYLNWTAAADLRDNNGAFESFRYAGINWFNYRGTDDNSTVAIAIDKVKFFPVNADIFQWALSPGEKFEYVNTLGRDMYSWMAIDPIRDMWADVEGASYPLPVCIQPSALASGRAGT